MWRCTGIGVWNPAFDVAPADLITGIITEVGVAKKAEGDEKDFKLRKFCAKHAA